jgi:hypothetical protein
MNKQKTYTLNRTYLPFPNFMQFYSKFRNYEKCKVGHYLLSSYSCDSYAPLSTGMLILCNHLDTTPTSLRDWCRVLKSKRTIYFSKCNVKEMLPRNPRWFSDTPKFTPHQIKFSLNFGFVTKSSLFYRNTCKTDNRGW